MNEFTNNKENFLSNLSKGWRNVVVITLICLVLVSLATVIQPIKYGSTMRVLVVQEYSGLADPYTSSKATQYLSDILAEVVYSTSFYNQVMDSGFNIDESYFPQDENKIKKAWGKTISARSAGDTGIITLTAYHTDKKQAEQIVRAVAYVLRTNHAAYHGSGNRVSVRVIENAITSNWPVKPNILTNVFLALVFGLCLGAGFIYLYPELNINLWPKKKEEVVFTEPNHIPEDFTGEVKKEGVEEAVIGA